MDCRVSTEILSFYTSTLTSWIVNQWSCVMSKSKLFALSPIGDHFHLKDGMF